MSTATTTAPIAWVKTDGGRAAAGYKGRTNDCVTRAIAIAEQMPYQRAYLLVADATGKSPRLGVPKPITRKLLADLGWVWTPTMVFGQGCSTHLQADELPGGRLIVKLSRHVVAVIDGVVHDVFDPSWDGRRCVYGYWRKP